MLHYKRQILLIGAGGKPHIFSTLFCEFVRPLLVSVLSTVATTSRLFAALLIGLGSFQFFSQLFSTVLNDLCTSFQIFPPLLNSSHDFSLLVNSSQRFSSLSTSCQFFSWHNRIMHSRNTNYARSRSSEEPRGSHSTAIYRDCKAQ